MEANLIKEVPANVIELLSSIAKKEEGIKDIIDKETKKLETVLENTEDFDKILDINDSIKAMIETLSKTELTTKENLENILKVLN